MEEAEVFIGGLFAVVHADEGGKAVGVDEAVDHFESHRLHGVLLGEREVCEVLVVEVAHLPHC